MVENVLLFVDEERPGRRVVLTTDATITAVDCLMRGLTRVWWDKCLHEFGRYVEQEVKVIWQKALHGGAIPRLGVTPGDRKLYQWIPGVGSPISVP